MAGLSGNIDHLNPIEVEVEVGLGLSLAIIRAKGGNREAVTGWNRA